MAIPFLQNVAQQYASHYDDLSDFIFVFPNKRGIIFFQRYLEEALDNEHKAYILPRMMAISEFIADLSGLIVDNRIDLLFTLYEEYCGMLGNKNISFESFRVWGDVVLSDFNEVDMACVDAYELFRNVREFKEIQSNFLTEDHLEIIREYFGGDVILDIAKKEYERFWRHFASDKLSDSKKRFVELWESLAILYDRLNKRLSSRGLTYSGHAYRVCLEKLKKDENLLGCSKVVFVGFNVLTLVEHEIFKVLSKLKSPIKPTENLADFIWDKPDTPPLEDDNNSAVQFIRNNINKFPKPDWLDLSESYVSSMPEVMTLTSTPSNSAQTFVIHNHLNDITEKLAVKEIDYPKVAVVLPDEDLLLPLLGTLNDRIGKVNITMGYPLRFTSTASLVSIIRHLHTKAREISGKLFFYHDDVKVLLAHPYIQLIEPQEKIGAFIRKIDQEKWYLVPSHELQLVFPDLNELFAKITDSSPQEVLSQLKKIFEKSRAAFVNMDREEETKSVDIFHINTYIDSINRLRDALSEHDIYPNWKEVFFLLERLLASESVTFEGLPLQGIQIMGLLETRSIDFDYVIIPSMNERIMPMRMRKRSFIPAALRTAYGMAPASFQEHIFSYYFYRLIARAKELHMIYNAQTEGVNSGERSRYIHQLLHIYAPDRIKQREVRMHIDSNPNAGIIEIEKTEDVMAELNKMLKAPPCDQDGKWLWSNEEKCLSHSSFMRYLQCPVMFYFAAVLNINEDKELSSYIDSAVAGSVIHEVLEEIYLPDRSLWRKYLTGQNVRCWNKDELKKRKSLVKKMLHRAINKFNYNKEGDALNDPLSPDLEMTVDIYERIIKDFIDNDAERAPVCIHGVEVKEKLRYAYASDKEVNVTYSIDRIDSVNNSGELCISDYKTGKVHLDSKDIDSLFEGSPTSSHALQLMFYALMASESLPGIDLEKIKLAIYQITDRRDFCKQLKLKKEGRLTIEDYSRFKELLDMHIADIFDPDKPFISKPGKVCEYCAFRQICPSALQN